MGHEVLHTVGGIARRRRVPLRGTSRQRRIRELVSPAKPRLAGLSSPELPVLVLAALALAAAGGERMSEGSVISGTPDVALMLRASVVSALILGGLLIQVSPARRQIGRLLLAVAVIPCLSLINVSQHVASFSIGVLALALTPVLFALVMLAFPTGRIESSLERKFIGAGVSVTLLLGFALSVVPRHAPQSPLVSSVLAPTLGDGGYPQLADGPTHNVLAWVVWAAALIVTAGTAVLMVSRASRANPRMRGLLAPMGTLAVLYGAAVAVCAITAALGNRGSARYGLELTNVATAVAIPLAIMLGVAVERMSLGRVLAGFVSNLGTEPACNVQAAMASTLNDPQLRIYYRREGTGPFLDAAGRRRLPAPSESRRQTAIGGDGRPAAVVDYDANLSGQEEFIRAAAATALLWVEQERLVTDLAAAKSNLEVSRLRLSRAADEERRQIQRDLHDGAQQHLIGMHIKLELALESMEAAPARSAGLLAEVGEEMSETARDLRRLASKVFPPTLKEYGLVDALASAIRTMGLSVNLEPHAVGRHPPEVEMQVYFVCLEGLQNIGKHCGPGVAATLRIWAVRRWLFFELRDNGPGFEEGSSEDGIGMQNMHDRLSSIGGWLSVVGRPGTGTVLKGVAPARLAHGPLR